MSFNPSGTSSKAALWSGRVLSVLVSLFLLMGAVMNILKTQQAIEGAKQYGYPEVSMIPLGVVVIVCLLLYLVPRTTVLGAILLTGYLGGAVATHVRASEFVWVLPALVVGSLVWLALVLRDPRIRALLPWRS